MGPIPLPGASTPECEEPTSKSQPCPQTPIGAKRVAWAVDRAPNAVPTLRRNAVEVIRSWGLDPDDDQVFATVLVLTELVTNASRHGRPALGLIDVDMWLDGDRVIVAVTDSVAEVPVMRKAGFGDESGRGLELINAYAESTGYEPNAVGKCVWAVIGPVPTPDPVRVWAAYGVSVAAALHVVAAAVVLINRVR
ncbi:ATP-binding protein [Streptomyces sp. XY431]|uniref:ATP-binding protein n=1 Tax=Streptomyces sp. XY431 TaxID=1415562 RepID=UPI0006AE9574|nr:ATP-binding protein [Streptomyces sp. XY431]